MNHAILMGLEGEAPSLPNISTDVARLTSDITELPPSSRQRFGRLIGQSVAIRRVFAILERIATTDVTVLVEGATGTGKELVAEAIHQESPRNLKPFDVLDCSAVSASLIEDSLFGHMRGAFTGATGDRSGAFEHADGGTLFLDEIGELPLELQPKLLRAIECRQIHRIGSNIARSVDVRIVAATNRALAREVELGRFREDLYHRINVVRVVLPPLRERIDDIALLVRHFEQQIPRRTRQPLSSEEINALSQHNWTGNVRELRNTVMRIHSLGLSDSTAVKQQVAPRLNENSEGCAHTHRDEQQPIDLSEGFFAARARVAKAFERKYLAAALEYARGNVSAAAQKIGVSRKFMHRAIALHKLRENGG